MTTTNDFLSQPGYINIESMDINVGEGSKPINIKHIIREMNIYEHLNEPFMTANIIVDDATSLMTFLPLTGEETIDIKFSLPGKCFEIKPFIKTFQIIAVQDISPTEKVRNVVYNIRCIAPEALVDWTTRVMKSYADQPISDMVKAVCKDYMTVSEPKVSETTGKRTIVIPNMHPTRALKFLAKEAKSEKYNPSNFIFFSNADGYFFKTIEELISEYQGSQDVYYVTEKNYFAGKDPATVGPNSIEEAGGQLPDLSVGGIQGALNPKPFEFTKINGYKFIKSFNLQDNLRRGAFDSKVLWIDVNKQVSKIETYKYQDNYDKFKRVDKNGGKFVKDKKGKLSNLKGDSNFKYIITDRESNQDTPEQKSEFLHFLTASVAMLDYVCLEINVPGDCTRRVGDIIEINFPEYSAFDNTIKQKNSYLAGKYLIVALRHMYNPDNTTGYSLIMQVVKNNFYKEPGELKKNSSTANTLQQNNIVEDLTK